jgi:cyclohexanone monooxygenase
LSSVSNPKDLDVVVVGAGFAGLYALHRLRGLGLSVRVFEAADGIGGTWYWNRYPGCRCDVESLEYSYSFSPELEQEWEWTERYASQPEILRYLNHVADRFDLRRDIRLSTRVEAARFDEAEGRWRIRTADGEVAARWLVMAAGCLSAPNTPPFPGQETFGGAVYHTGRWPHEPVDFAGQRVAVIGTGSSAIQAIPLIAEQADQLIVFQRTATYTVPARNRPLSAEEQRRVKADYPAFREGARRQLPAFYLNIRNQSALEVEPEERRRVYDERWALGGAPFGGSFNDLLLDLDANRTAADYVRERISELVEDPDTAERLKPAHVFACKRPCLDTGYYETFNRANVALVDVAGAPIEALTPRGLRTATREYEVDSIVFATGFDAVTGAVARIDIRGRNARSLKDAWAEGPRAYLGLMTAGFPNLFLVTGPGSPSVLSNMVASIEQHVDLIAEVIEGLSREGLDLIEPEPAAQDAWVEHVNAVASGTLYPQCNSWYLGANVPGKPRVFMPYLGFPAYVAKCEEVVARGFEGFVRTSAPSTAALPV